MGNSSKINNQRRSSLIFIYIDREGIRDFVAVQAVNLGEGNQIWWVLSGNTSNLSGVIKIWHYIQNAFQIKKADLLRAEVKI